MEERVLQVLHGYQECSHTNGHISAQQVQNRRINSYLMAALPHFVISSKT